MGCATTQPWRSAVQRTSARESDSTKTPQAPQVGGRQANGAPRTYRRFVDSCGWKVAVLDQTLG